jgi:endonuclease/exonuclease/phosphatase family metal-dependent hydrolase
MSDYYYSSPHESSTGRKNRRRSLSGRLFDFVMVIISIVVSVLVLLTLLAPVVNPHRMWILSLLALGAPLIYATLILLILYWVIRWRWKYIVPMALVALLGVGKVSRYYRITPVQDHSAQQTAAERQRAERGTFSVMTYNIGNFKPYFGIDKDPVRAVAKGAEVIDSLAPDIICLQEFQSTPACPREMFDTLLTSRKYRGVVSLRLTTHPKQGHGVGNAIYTRYKIVRSGVINNATELDSTACIAQWADLMIGDDTVRVVNNHLRTTMITQNDQEYLVSGDFIEDGSMEREDKLRSIADRFQLNSQIRADQADTISRFVAASPYRVIVCGDFNDGAMSYTYRRIGRKMDDTFVEAARGKTNTYRGFFNLLRIDFIFVDRRFEVLSYSSPRLGVSDHYPVVSRLKIRRD